LLFSPLSLHLLHPPPDCGDGTTGDCKTQSNQRGINLGIKSSGIDRSKLFITTKVPGCGLQGISRDKCGEDSVAAALDNLVELGVDYGKFVFSFFFSFSYL
jgi:hypothetical protein